MNNCLIDPFVTEFNYIRTFVVMLCTPKTEADPGGRGSGARAPIQTSQKKGDCHAALQVSQVIGLLFVQISGSATKR